MSVYVILDGVRREYPEATGWKGVPTGVAIFKLVTRTIFPSEFMTMDEDVIAQFGRYDVIEFYSHTDKVACIDPHKLAEALLNDA